MFPEQPQIGPVSPTPTDDPGAAVAPAAPTPVAAKSGMAYPPYPTSSPNPPYSPYQPYPPSPVYPPYTSYPPPALYQAPPTQPIWGAPAPANASAPYAPPYGTYPWGAPGQGTPVPTAGVGAGTRRRAVWPITLAVVGIVLVVALVIGSVVALLSIPSRAFSQTQSPFSSPLQSPTPSVSVTNYSTPLPGQCDTNHPEYWQALENTTTSCTSSALVITNAADAQTISEVSFQPAGVTFPTVYTVSADASSTANACVGVSVLRHNYAGYSLFACPDGSWEWNIYSVTGLGSRLDTGTVPTTSSYHLVVSVTASQVTLSINDKNLLTTSRLTTFTTEWVGLQVEPFTASLVATGDFSNFAYAQS